MDLGVRQIRTAGKGSGSVELTLPGELRHLIGLPCRITLHDGVRPDIILQPDLTPARSALAALWAALARILSGAASPEAGPFPAASFSFGLNPLPSTQGAPYLSWQDGLALAAGTTEASPLARCIAACATQYASEIDVAAPLSAAFGAVCGFLAGGTLVFPDWQEACDIAGSEMAKGSVWLPGAAWRTAPDTHSQRFWEALAPGVVAASRMFAAWSLPESTYPALCAAWRRGRSIELNRG